MTHDVYRWHSHPDPRLRNSGDTIDRHQKRVQTLCHSLAAHLCHDLYDSDLLQAARHHDEAEKVLGDMPGPAKVRFPRLAAEYSFAEVGILREMGYDWKLTPYENDMLVLCDRLDAWQWARSLGVTSDEWDRARDDLRRRAYSVGLDAMDWLETQLETQSFTHDAADHIIIDAEVIKAAEALAEDVLELLAYRAQCAAGSVDLLALANKMRVVERSLAAFRQAQKSRATLEEKNDDE